MSGLFRLMRQEATTKRATMTNGVSSLPVEHLPILRCTPLDIIDADTARSLALDSPYNLFQTFTNSEQDILGGDVFIPFGGVHDGREMAVRNVSNWDWDGRTRYLHIVLERTST